MRQFYLRKLIVRYFSELDILVEELVDVVQILWVHGGVRKEWRVTVTLVTHA